MSARILDGKATAARIKEELRELVAALRERGVVPGLGTVLVGEDPGAAENMVVNLSDFFRATLEVEPGAKVLDVATGYGYAAAIFAALGADVVGLESDATFADAARTRLASAARPVEVVTAPLPEGCPDQAPFDVVLINGVVETRPNTLLGQLREGGRLACFERDGAATFAVIYVRAAAGFSSRRLFDSSAPTLPAFRAEAGFRF